MKHQIKHRYTDAVLFECDVPDDVQASGIATRHALEQAVKAHANLVGAYLVGAYLDGANLAGAKLGDKTLVGERPVLMIGPIGSRASYFAAYITDAGVIMKAGCFTGTMQEFTDKLAQEHGDNDHATEYRAALSLIECHAKLWGAK